MCGIVGWISGAPKTYPLDRRKFMDAALVIDTLRGPDSTGVFSVAQDKRKKRPSYEKSVCSGPEFIETAAYNRMYTDLPLLETRAMIGHNRKATMGSISPRTAHPFQVGPITLVHNGTLTATTAMEHSMDHVESHNDSHAIARNLADMDRMEVLEALQGAFALVWHDSRDHTINIARNSQRPLHMAKSSFGDTVYIASEAEMLFWLGAKLKLNLGKIVEPRPGRLLTFTREAGTVPEVTDFTMGKGVAAHYKKMNPGGYGNHYSPAPGTVPTRHITTPIHAPTAEISADPKVLVAGKKIPLPVLLEEQLMDYDLEPTTLVEFCPKLAHKVTWPRKKHMKTSYMVTGYIRLPGNLSSHLMNAAVYGVPETVWKAHGTHTWTMRPLGILELGTDKPGLVLKIVRYTGYNGVKRYVNALEALDETATKSLPNPISERTKEIINASAKKSAMAADEREEEEDSPAAAKVPGKYGAMVSEQTWYKDTKNGCVFCDSDVFRVDAYDIEWVNEGQDPLCISCSNDRKHEKATEGLGYQPCSICSQYELESLMRNYMCIDCQEDHLNGKTILEQK